MPVCSALFRCNNIILALWVVLRQFFPDNLFCCCHWNQFHRLFFSYIETAPDNASLSSGTPRTVLMYVGMYLYHAILAHSFVSINKWKVVFLPFPNNRYPNVSASEWSQHNLLKCFHNNTIFQPAPSPSQPAIGYMPPILFIQIKWVIQQVTEAANEFF